MKIWMKPELAFEESYAHDLLAKELEDSGFSIQRHYITPTAFRAEYSIQSSGDSPVVAILCEYDALPEIGHACGHNLIAEVGFAAALAVKAALEANPALPGKIVVLGTPAEEVGAGKVLLLEGNAFNDIDFCLMAHPAPHDQVYTKFIAVSKIKVKYQGKAAHASGFPWEGLNALDAAVLCYTNIGLLRQQLKPLHKIHGVITKGGTAPNIIPACTELSYFIRAPSTRDLQSLTQRVISCFLAAGTATGCEMKYEYIDQPYKHLITNRQLAALYKSHAEELGISFIDGNTQITPFVASSDVGNVSHALPTIQPTFNIGTMAPNHSEAFTQASGSKAAQQPSLVAAKALALTALDIFANPELLKKAKEQFREDLKADTLPVA